MEVITVQPDLLRERFESFESLNDETLQWVIDNSEFTTFEPGDKMMEDGAPVDHMLMLLEGKAQYLITIGGQQIVAATIPGGSIGGVLPYSRLKVGNGNMVAVERCEALLMHRDKFKEMERVSQELVQNLVILMTNRVREGTKSQQNIEKMSALGKMSAGIAHELNNPAAAIVRIVDAMREKMSKTPEKIGMLVDAGVTKADLDRMGELIEEKSSAPRKPMSALDKGDCEDELIDWLEDNGMDDPFETAEALVDAGLVKEDLEEIMGHVDQSKWPALMKWLEGSLAARVWLAEVEEASKRISELVASIKNYSHMDRAPEKERMNVRSGLENTLTMLNHKLKRSTIELKLNFEEDLPDIEGYPGELNQVWTNLIDNALDAMAGSGTLTIEAHREGDFVKVIVRDTGSGIPEDIQNKIFEPFFTTKEQGQGTGLGLDIVHRIIQRHNGDIKVHSKPGCTEFVLCFPIVP